MSRRTNQKTKLLRLSQILLRQTDEDHPMTVAQIIDALDRYDISAERKSIYDDLETLRSCGLDVQSRKGKSPGSSPRKRATRSWPSWSSWPASTRPGSSSGRSTSAVGSR